MFASVTHRLAPSIVAAALLLVPSGALPQNGGHSETAGQEPGSAEVRGREIALEADRRATEYGDLRARLTMVLRNRHGDERTRQMRIRVLEGTDAGDRTLLVFDRPRDLTGTALLTHANRDGGDDQWLYLPALKRVKRIAGGGQSGSFMGSEFAYEDIGSQEVEKYRYRFRGEDILDEGPCLVVERVPRDPDSGYSRQLVWYHREAYRVLQIEYYDRQGDHLKTLRMRGYRRYLEHHWRPALMEMVNHQSGKSTTITWAEYEFDTGLRERDFDPTALGRAR